MPKVSVAMWTYNHERFIAQAIESVLMQQTDFPIELVVGEDCSTDSTRNVVAHYARLHPGIVRPLFQSRNLGPALNSSAVLAKCHGEYVACLDGDDYWTDPLKLARQVALLDQHQESSASYHRISIVGVDGTPQGRYPTWDKLLPLQVPDVLEEIGAHTASLIYRRKLLSAMPAWAAGLEMGDWPLVLTLATLGPIMPVEGELAAYRVHGGGVWSGAPGLRRQEAMEEFYVRVLAEFPLRQVESLLPLRKANLFALFRSADGRNDRKAARRWLWNYWLSRPSPFRLPPCQLRAVVRCLLPLMRQSDQCQPTASPKAS